MTKKLAGLAPVLPILLGLIAALTLSAPAAGEGTCCGCWCLPDNADMTLYYPGDDNTYFDVTLSNVGSGYDIENDNYLGWCADADKTIIPGGPYSVEVYSSYDPAGRVLVEYPENLDSVNWILNQDFTSQYSDNAGRPYTWGDIQWAIWKLIEDQIVPDAVNSLGTKGENAAQEIVENALAYGEGFYPSNGEVGTVLLEVGSDNQTIFIEVPCRCGEIISTDSSGDEKNHFLPEENVYAGGSGLVPDSQYDIYVVDNKDWTCGSTIPDDVTEEVETVTTDGSGNFSTEPVWPSPLTPGHYDIVADHKTHGTQGEFDACDAVDDLDVSGAGFFVVSEFGPLVALVAGFGATFAFIFWRRRIPA